MSVNGTSSGCSRLATQAHGGLKAGDKRTIDAYGVCVHTTGLTVVEKALAQGLDPFDYASAYYSRPETYWAHYLIGHEGQVVQFTDERQRAQHVGLTRADRAKYLSGAWRDDVSTAMLREWLAAWHDMQSPSHLYPGSSPNNAYVGVELLAHREDFTEAQYVALAGLAVDVAERWHFPMGWERTGRLVGHEDITPMSRSNRFGGWDPGARRVKPLFSWDLVRQLINRPKLA